MHISSRGPSSPATIWPVTVVPANPAQVPPFPPSRGSPYSRAQAPCPQGGLPSQLRLAPGPAMELEDQWNRAAALGFTYLA